MRQCCLLLAVAVTISNNIIIFENRKAPIFIVRALEMMFHCNKNLDKNSHGIFSMSPSLSLPHLGGNLRLNTLTVTYKIIHLILHMYSLAPYVHYIKRSICAFCV